MRPTEPATLVVAGLAAAAVAWLLISNFYQDLPPMIWPPVLIFFGLAGFEAVVARQLWVRIHQRTGLLSRQPGRPGMPAQEPIEPLAVARYAVLAKASSVAAAIFVGVYAGFLPWLLIESSRVTEAGADLPPTIGGLIASLLFLAAAQWLERACRVPERDEDDDPDPKPDVT
ncbi:MAG TPA: DUF3180 domain-containing protein [Natronosporangium sp.]